MAVDRIHANMIRLSFDSKDTDESNIRLVNLETLLSSSSVKTLEYYGTLNKAINELLAVGCGGVEIPPQLSDNNLTYLMANKDVYGDVHLNLVIYASRLPSNTRPFTFSDTVELDWQIGDIVFNTDFIHNRCLGWICTTAGSPGKWELVGNLDALNNRTTYQLIESGQSLPTPSINNVGSFALYADPTGASRTTCTLWYCTRYEIYDEVLRRNVVSYKWVNTNYNKSPFKQITMTYSAAYESWLVLRVDEQYINPNDSNYYTSISPELIAVYGTVPEGPVNTRDYQTLRFGTDRYYIHYYNEDNVYEGDIPAGIQILLFIDYTNKKAWLPYQKSIPLELVQALPTPNAKMLGRRVLYKVEGLNDYPVPYYCTKLSDDEYKWIPYTPTKYPVQIIEMILAADNSSWKVTSIGTHAINDNTYETKVSDTLLLVGIAPTRSNDNQKLIIYDKTLTIRYLDGSTVVNGDILENSVIQIQVNLTNKTATLNTYPRSVIVDKTVVRVSTMVSMTGGQSKGQWMVTSIGDLDTSGLNTDFKNSIPDKLVLLTQIPSNSIDNQVIWIGTARYNLKYINGVDVMQDELTKGSIIAIHGNAKNENVLYVPSFPSLSAQQIEQMIQFDIRLTEEMQQRKQLSDTMLNYKIDSNTLIESVNNRIDNILGDLGTTDSLARLESPAFTGYPTAPTANLGDSSLRLATTAFVMTAISELIDGAPETLNTLSELSRALNNNPNIINSIINELGNKLSISGGTVNNTLILSNQKVPSAATNNNPAIVIGNSSGIHTELGLNAIQSKNSSNTATTIYINKDGGQVSIGPGGIYINGPVVIKGDITLEGNIELTGNITTNNGTVTANRFEGRASEADLAYNIPNSESNGNIWMNN